MKFSTIIANVILGGAIVAALPTPNEAGGPHSGARREADPNEAKTLTGPHQGARREADPNEAKTLTGPHQGARREAEPKELTGPHNGA